MDAKPNYHIELGEANRHVAWTFGRLRYLSCMTKDQIRQDCLWEDFEQELKTIAYDAWLKKLSMPETWRYATNRIRAFLSAYGYKRYRNGYIRQERAFSAVWADWQVSNLADPEVSLSAPLGKDRAGDNHLLGQILNALKRKPEGLTRANLSMLLEMPVKEVQEHLNQLLKEKRIMEIRREAWEGRITPLYLMAGAKVPEQRLIHTEMYERIRQAYQAGMSLSWIAREYHHSFHTIYRAIRMAPMPLTPTSPAVPERELIPA